MLTSIQKGMVESYMYHCLVNLVQYFRDIMHDVTPWRETIIDLLHTANNETVYQGQHYQTSADKTPLKNALPIIKYELWGIFHADWDVLNKLGLINGQKDIPCLPHDLTLIASEIRECAQKAINFFATRLYNMTVFTQPPHSPPNVTVLDQEEIQTTPITAVYSS